MDDASDSDTMDDASDSDTMVMSSMEEEDEEQTLNLDSMEVETLAINPVSMEVETVTQTLEVNTEDASEQRPVRVAAIVLRSDGPQQTPQNQSAVIVYVIILCTYSICISYLVVNC